MGAVDGFLRHPFVFFLASLSLAITPVVTSLPYAVSAIGFAIVVAWRHFVYMGTAAVAVSIATATLVGWFFSEHTAVFWAICAVVAGSILWAIWPERLGDGSRLPVPHPAGGCSMLVAIHSALCELLWPLSPTE